MFKILGSPRLRQYAVVLIANFNTLVVGFGLGWTSPILVKLVGGNDTVLSRPITENEASWIVALPFLTGVISNLFAGYFLDTIGRKYCLFLSAVPRVPVVLLYLFGTEVWMMMAARFISGLLDSLAFTAIATFASEVASKEIRGSLGTFLQIYSSLGISLALGIGPFVSYITLNIVFLAISVVACMLMLILPDTPYFLYSKGKTDDARKLLIKLRGSEFLAIEEIKEYQLASSPEEGKVSIKELLKNKLFLKGAVICVVLAFSSQTNGYTAVFQYLQTILETTNTSVRPEIASVIVGGIQLIASFFTALVTDRFGRKIILISTTAGIAVGLVGMSIFFKVTEDHKEVFGFMNYLPLASIILIVFCNSAGISSVLWILMGELFEGRTRAIGSSVGLLVATLSGFGASKSMPSLTSSIGPSMTYGLFGVICVMTIIFTAIFIPETKGKSFAEIQAILGKKDSDFDSNKDKNVNDVEKSS